jgi:Protein of unknown function (DUF2938)
MILEGIAMGVGATILMDLWAWLLSRLPGQAPVNWAPVGRWVWHLRGGRLFHADIGAAAPYAHEQALGWAFHSAVGIVYGIAFALIAGGAWLAHPTFGPAWIFGLATILFGWFLLQPGLGIGWAAEKLPNRWRVRLLGLVGHSVFAAGLYAIARLIA